MLPIALCVLRKLAVEAVVSPVCFYHHVSADMIKDACGQVFRPTVPKYEREVTPGCRAEQVIGSTLSWMCTTLALAVVTGLIAGLALADPFVTVNGQPTVFLPVIAAFMIVAILPFLACLCILLGGVAAYLSKALTAHVRELAQQCKADRLGGAR